MKKILSKNKKGMNQIYRVKKKDNSLKFILALIGIPNAILLISVFLMLIYISSYMADSANDSGRYGTFTEALSDSIEMYGKDFPKALAAYHYEHKSFRKYDRIAMLKYQNNKILKTLMEKDGVLEYYEDYKVMYDGIINKDNNGKIYHEWYFPIADNYKVSNTDDYKTPRSFGGVTEHFGNDLMCQEGVPVIAVEDGQVDEIGWNYLGGWRIGITSLDGNRYWYYAHMRKMHPFIKGLDQGAKIKAGSVIGYVGSTGQSDILANNTMPENDKAVEKQFADHLHLSVMKKNGKVNVWYNPYPLLEFLKRNKVAVENSGVIKAPGEEHVAIAKSIEARYVYINRVFAAGKIGGLSEKYESNGDPGSISNTPGDIGGKSYGAFQFASAVNSLLPFLMWLNTADSEIYNKLITAYKLDGGNYANNFDKAWKSIANENPARFYNLQYAYIEENYFLPVVNYFRENNIIDFTTHSKALQNAVWSTAVQHGTGGAIGIINKLHLKADDASIITELYRERQKVGSYFADSSYAVKQSVYNRFSNELSDALLMLNEEKDR